MSKSHAQAIEFATKTKTGWCSPLASAQIHYFYTGTHWISSLDYEFNCGDHEGCHSPMYGKHKTQLDAITPHLKVLIRFLKAKIQRGAGYGCASIVQMEQAAILLTQVEQYAGAETSDGQMSMFEIGG